MKGHPVPARITAAVIGLVAAALVVLGCATTKIRSQADPDLRGRTFQKVMVFVNFSNFALREDAERRFQTSLSGRATAVVRSVDLFFPGRAYSSDEVARILREAGVDAVLVASSTGSGATSVWIPPVTTTQASSTTTTEGNATLIGNTASGTATSTTSGRATTTTSGGYNVNKPWANFEAALHDVSSGSVVWMASMSSGGNAYAGWDDLAKSMAKKTAEQLLKDGVIR